MKLIFRVLFICIFSLSYASANEYADIKIIKLKKDEQKKILVKYGATKKLFKFRWTLFTNGGLVLFRSYDRIVAQNVLYLRHKNQSFRVELKTRGADFYNVPYILVKFKEFNYETNEATFELYLSDRKSQISLDYLQNS
ncbi:hypothetical protein [Sulfurimonas sp.]